MGRNLCHALAPVPSLSALLADRRKLFLLVTGAVVALALVVVAAVVLLGGDDDGSDVTAGPTGPIELATPTTADVFNLAGEPAQLSTEDLEAVLTTVEGYLTAATLNAPTTELPEEGETTTTAAGTSPPSDPRPFFTDAASAQFETDDASALSDGHLAPADGASPQSATVPSLAGLVGDDGAGQLVALTIDVTTVVDLDDDVIIRRTGDLVLEPTEAGWRISGYDLTVERTLGSETTTTQAAFGARRPL